MGIEVCASGEPPLSYKEQCKEWHETRAQTRSDDANRLGVPLIFSEYGACFDSPNCYQEISQLADAADNHLAGWAYWQMKNFKDLTTTAGTGSEGIYNMDGTLQ